MLMGLISGLALTWGQLTYLPLTLGAMLGMDHQLTEGSGCPFMPRPSEGDSDMSTRA